ncbi:sporulation and spore germination protein [Haloactinospora alba]|uniref:Sporulation and spore germination protein n=1 Tax=Haloactinospora alba TaxID=405555 RepID=A0A543NF44_9ACTN|nr:LpqB family beta-propeller domain-containing protein [Haloactinospora alba]TQN30449.1 sporulation and spore germination protein [Haloactinospora alba]
MSDRLAAAPLRALLAAVAVLGLVSACASVPTNSPVVSGSGGDEGGDPYRDYVRMLPAGPQPGADTEGLIKGFLRDMASFEDDHEAAKEYLTPKTRAEWSSDGPVLVYEDMESTSLDAETADDGNSATVRLQAPQVATIHRNGQYAPAGEESAIDVTFELVQNGDGEWRIRNLPEKLFLDRQDVGRAYRTLNLYYFNRSRERLVPDPVLLPASSKRLPTRLVEMLVAGPTDWLAPAVRSTFPNDAESDVSFDSESGTVTLELDGGVDSQDHFEMGAQLERTLGQLSQVQNFQLRVDGQEVEYPDEANRDLQSDGAYWESVRPSGGLDDASAYFLRDGQLWSLSAEGQYGSFEETRLQGAPGAGEVGLDQHAVSLDEGSVAGITEEGDEVVLSGTSENSHYRTVLSGGEYDALSWDGYGNLWVAEHAPADTGDEDGDGGDDEEGSGGKTGTRLWLLREGTEATEVATPDLGDRRITQFRVSRDGVRLAAVTREKDGPGRLEVARVVYGEQGVSVAAPLPMARELSEVTDLAWHDADRMAVLGKKEDGAVQGLLVSLDGSTGATSAGAPSGTNMTSVAAAPSRPLLAGTEDSEIRMTHDRVGWQRVTDGDDPVYPG